MSIPYYHVDAFTDELFGGNPAGVCILGEFPTEVTMQKIAAENRHSQTAFVVALTVILTCAGSRHKSRTIYAVMRPWRLPMCLPCVNMICGQFAFILAVVC
jgi:hypothetical protein